MDDLFKKFINTGVGFLSQSNKRVQTALDKLVKESKISEQEGKKIMDDLLKSGETKRQDLEKQFQGLAGSLRSRVGSEARTAAPAAPAKTAKAAGSASKSAVKTNAAKVPRSTTAKAKAPRKTPAKSADDGSAKTGEA